MTEKNLLDELLEIDTVAATAPTNTDLQVFATRTDVIVPDPIEVPDATPRSPQEDDIAFARRKMRIIIKAAESAFNELAIVANETQQPRAYEVLATLLKTATDATKELVGTHKTRAEIKRLEMGSGLNTAFDNQGNTNFTQVNQNIEQAVFVGTASEMLDRIDKQRQEQLQLLESEKVDE